MFTSLVLSFYLFSSNYIVVDLNKLKFYAYDNNNVLVREGKAIGGRARCLDQPKSCKTPQGTFTILKKYGQYKRSIKYPLGCKGRKCARMGWFQKFHPEGIGLHASDEINVDFNASHGCVRLHKEDAKWLSEWTKVGDKVIVLPYITKR